MNQYQKAMRGMFENDHAFDRFLDYGYFSMELNDMGLHKFANYTLTKVLVLNNNICYRYNFDQID